MKRVRAGREEIKVGVLFCLGWKILQHTSNNDEKIDYAERKIIVGGHLFCKGPYQ